VTFTRTHVYITFADPFLQCNKCDQPVPQWHDDDQCGCDDGWWNMPCGHRSAGVYSVCPSWSPVDGCHCQEYLGYIPHDAAPHITGGDE